MKFNSQVQEIGSFKSNWTDEEIKNEPMLFNCDTAFAYANAGPITQSFIRALTLSDWYQFPSHKWIIDSRVHMLMPNWYPCIPGYHHDDIPRSTANGQPNYLDPEYKAVHALGLVNAEICPTQFALGEIELDLPSSDKIIYKEWHPLVDSAVKSGQMQDYKAKSGVITQFDGESFHQGTKAVTSGWRWFIRVSQNTGRKPTNEIRKQVQVYLEYPMEGW